MLQKRPPLPAPQRGSVQAGPSTAPRGWWSIAGPGPAAGGTGTGCAGAPRAAFGSSGPIGEPGATPGPFRLPPEPPLVPRGPSPSRRCSAPWMPPTSTRVSPRCMLHLSRVCSFSRLLPLPATDGIAGRTGSALLSQSFSFHSCSASPPRTQRNPVLAACHCPRCHAGGFGVKLDFSSSSSPRAAAPLEVGTSPSSRGPISSPGRGRTPDDALVLTSLPWFSFCCSISNYLMVKRGSAEVYSSARKDFVFPRTQTNCRPVSVPAV